MSGSKQRKARQENQRAQRQREQERLAAERREHKARVLSIAVLVVVAVSVVAILATITISATRTGGGDTPVAVNTELLDAEASADAQSSAAAKAMAAGKVMAENFTVEPGTRVGIGEAPPPDNRPVACGAKVPDNAGVPRPRYPGGPAEVLQEGVDYVARIETSCGTITVDLLEKDSPIAVNSFVFLAEDGFYDGLEVFRDFGGVGAAQTGSGNNTGNWDIGYSLPDELRLAKRKGYPIGTVTTVGEGPYTAGSQFFIVYGEEFDAAFRDDRSQTAFGRVLSGMDAIYTMTRMPRVGMGAETYAKRLFLESVTIMER